MSFIEKKKIEHDFLNSIVIINSLAKSTTGFLKKILGDNIDTNNYNQIEKIICCMSTIQEQTIKIEKHFQYLLNH